MSRGRRPVGASAARESSTGAAWQGAIVLGVRILEVTDLAVDAGLRIGGRRFRRGFALPCVRRRGAVGFSAVLALVRILRRVLVVVPGHDVSSGVAIEATSTRVSGAQTSSRGSTSIAQAPAATVQGGANPDAACGLIRATTHLTVEKGPDR